MAPMLSSTGGLRQARSQKKVLVWSAVVFTLLPLSTWSHPHGHNRENRHNEDRKQNGETIAARRVHRGAEDLSMLQGSLANLLQLGDDWDECVDSVEDSIAGLERMEGSVENIRDDTTTSLLEMWSFLNGSSSGLARSTNRRSCQEPSQVLCKALLQCNESCPCYGLPSPSSREAFEGICLELRYNHAVLTPLLDDGEAKLHPWFQLLEKNLCPEDDHGYSACSIVRMENSSQHQYSCSDPLQTTRFPSRQNKDFFSTVTLAWINFAAAENGTAGPTFTRYPCGKHCSKLDQNSWRTRFLDIIARLSGCIQVAMGLIAGAAALRTGLWSMCQYPNRLQLYLAAAVFLFSLFLIPHIFKPFTGEEIACYDDNTAQSDADLKENAACVYTFAMSSAGGMMFQLITLFIALAWWQLVLKLRMKRDTWYKIRMQGKVEVIWLLASAAWSITVVVVQYMDKEPLKPFLGIEFCISLYQGSEFISYTPYILFLTCTLLVLVDGLRRMKRVRRISVSIKVQCGIKRKRTADRAMRRIVKHLKHYIIGLFLIGVIEVTFRFIDPPGEVDMLVNDKLKQFQKCIVASCGCVERCHHLRAELPNQRIIVGVLFDTFAATLAVLLCSWALKLKVWRRKAIQNRSRKSITGMLVKSATVTAQFAVSASTVEKEDGDSDSSQLSNTKMPGKAHELTRQQSQLTLVSGTLCTKEPSSDGSLVNQSQGRNIIQSCRTMQSSFGVLKEQPDSNSIIQ